MDGEHTQHHSSQTSSLKQEGDFFPSLPRYFNSCTSTPRYLLPCNTWLKCCQTLHVCFMHLQTCRGSPRAQGPDLACAGTLCRTTLLQTGECCTSPASKALVGFASLIATQRLHCLLRQVWLKKSFMSFTQFS